MIKASELMINGFLHGIGDRKMTDSEKLFLDKMVNKFEDKKVEPLRQGYNPLIEKIRDPEERKKARENNWKIM